MPSPRPLFDACRQSSQTFYGFCDGRLTGLRQPDLFERSRLWLRDRSLRNKDFGVSGTLGGEWQPASNQANDIGSRQRAREC